MLYHIETFFSENFEPLSNLEIILSQNKTKQQQQQTTTTKTTIVNNHIDIVPTNMSNSVGLCLSFFTKPAFSYLYQSISIFSHY